MNYIYTKINSTKIPTQVICFEINRVTMLEPAEEEEEIKENAK